MDQSNRSKISVWDIVSVFIKWRRLLILNFFAAAVLTFIIASFLPKWYTSSASIFPPAQESTGLGFASLLGGGLGSMLSSSGMSLPAFATLSDIHAAILLSRQVSERVIEENNLMEIYDTESLEAALEVLASHRFVRVEPTGIIVIDVEDKDPEFAAQLVNSFIDGLDWINLNVRTSQASATREFIEERLNQTKVELEEAEMAYRNFQLKHKAISLELQLRGMIDNLAKLKGELVLAEIELGVLKRSLLPTHTNVKQQEARIEEIEKQIKLLEVGDSGKSDGERVDIPIFDTPDLSLELVRLTRNLKVQETIFELLTQQYEQTKIQEKKDTPTVQVLDSPKVPEKKSRPKRATMALLAGILCVFLTTITVFIKEFIDRNKAAGTETYEYLEKFSATLKDDFYAMRSIFSSKKRGN